ncbi:MAG: aspartate ammonia-lyase [Pseudomonadota bacterium]
MPAEPTRIESDSLGQVKVPATALYGSNTVRAMQNFPLGAKTLGQESTLLNAIVDIKKSAALANNELGKLNHAITNAIVSACDEILNQSLNHHFPVPLLEGSGGTSTNMNVNEVICNRALQLLNKAPGDYTTVHPNDHVNLSQSTNDVLPSAIKLACYRRAQPLSAELIKLSDTLNNKAHEFNSVFRLGRTCLQDAQPMTLGQAFSGYAAATKRAADKILLAAESLTSLPLGGTAIGTGMGSAAGFKYTVFKHLSNITGVPLSPAENPFDGLQNIDALQRLSAELEAASAVCAKVSKDLILLSSGPNGGLAEITLPAVQPGSSIMPGKVNPVLPMAMIQLSQVIHGNHACIAMACQDGMLEINHYEMAVASRLLDSLQLLTQQTAIFTTHCVAGISANTDHCQQQLQQSYALATALIPELGYRKVSKLVRESVNTGRPFLQICEEQQLIRQTDITALLQQATTVVK